MSLYPKGDPHTTRRKTRQAVSDTDIPKTQTETHALSNEGEVIATRVVTPRHTKLTVTHKFFCGVCRWGF